MLFIDLKKKKLITSIYRQFDSPWIFPPKIKKKMSPILLIDISNIVSRVKAEKFVNCVAQKLDILSW